MKARFEWIKSPDILIEGVERYGEQMLVAVQAAATYWGQHIQNEARTNAEWTDRTPAARPGLFFAVDGFGFEPIVGTVTPEAKAAQDDVEFISGDKNTLIIALGHTVYYGKFLEWNDKYAIIMSTIEENLNMLERLIEEYAQRIR